MKKSFGYLFIHAVVLSACLCAGIASAAEPQAEIPSSGGISVPGATEPIDYTADKISYNQKKNMITGEGNGVINYKGMSLRADKMVAYLDTQDIYADGNVVFSSGGQVFTGQKVHYNYKTGLGDFLNGSGFVDPWYGRGKVIRKTAENEFQVSEGYVTSCNYEDMHYKITAKKIFIYPGDRMIARDVVFWLGNFPMIWSPLFSRSLRDERERFTVVPGYNKRFGGFVLTGINFWYDPYLTGTLHNDYYTKRGYGVGVDLDYRFLDRMNNIGSVKAYGIRDKNYQPTQQPTVTQGYNPNSGQPVNQNTNQNVNQDNTNPVVKDMYRYRISANHEAMLAKDIRAVGQLRLQSDQDIINDFFRDEFEREVQPENYIDITKATPDYTVTLFARKKMNDLFNELEKLPELRFVLPQKRLWKTPFYYNNDSTASYLNYSPYQLPSYYSFRTDTTHRISAPFRVFQFLNLEPFGVARGTFYTNGVQDNNFLRHILTAGIDSYVKFHKTFPDLSVGFLKIKQVRHVIEPHITYIYTHDPSKDPTELLQFDAVDALDRRNDIRFSVRNKLQTRRDDVTVDLVDYEIYTYYHPASRTPALDRYGNPERLSDVFHYLKLRPLDWIALDARLAHDINNNLIDSVDLDLQVLNGDKWSIALRERYLPYTPVYNVINPTWNSYTINDFSGNYTNGNTYGNNLIGVELIYRFNSDWLGKAFYRYDFELGKLEQQEYTIFRDLHCWEVAVTFRQRPMRDDLTAFVIFRLKDYPEVPIKLGN